MVPFVAPEEQERVRGRPFRARLGANESNFGPSPKAVRAMQEVAGDVWKYGDPKSHDLRMALSDVHDVSPSNIVVGEGIDGLLACVSQLLIAPGDAVVASQGTYPTLSYFVAGRGGTMQTVPYGSNDMHDIPALLKKAEEVRAKMIYFVNPDNPSGTFHQQESLENMIENLPEGCLLLLDEAYLELASPDSIPVVAVDDLRVLRLRTFSKAYGMAGARIGYALGAQEVITNFDKIRSHFGINRTGQKGALAALEDQQHLAWVREQIAESREEVGAIARTNGLTPLPSATNFVTIDCGHDAAFARLVVAELDNRDVFIRMPGAPPLNRCIRVSCGGPLELDLFREALPPALEAAAQRRDV